MSFKKWLHNVAGVAHSCYVQSIACDTIMIKEMQMCTECCQYYYFDTSLCVCVCVCFLEVGNQLTDFLITAAPMNGW